MQAYFQDFFRDFRQLSRESTYLLRLCLFVTLCLYGGASLCFFLAGRVGDYYALLMLSQELAALARPCVGLLGLAAMVFQWISGSSE